MDSRQLLAVAIVAIVGSGILTSAHSQSAPRISDVAKKARVELVSEFDRELEVLYRLQETAKKEFAEDSTPGKFATSIRMGTRTLFEMHDSIYRLRRIAVTDNWATFRDQLTKLHNWRIESV